MTLGPVTSAKLSNLRFKVTVETYQSLRLQDFADFNCRVIGMSIYVCLYIMQLFINIRVVPK